MKGPLHTAALIGTWLLCSLASWPAAAQPAGQHPATTGGTNVGAAGMPAPRAVSPASQAATKGSRELVTIEEMVTDRPDYTESSAVVPRGGFQFESGVLYEGDLRDGVRGRNLTVPGGLFRIGLGRRTELRIGGDGLLVQESGDVRVAGYSDLDLGVKIRLLSQKTAGLDVAVIPMASFPIGAERFSSGAIDPTVKLTWARTLPLGFGATGNFNLASVSDDAGRFAQRTVSVSIGHDFIGGWGGFAESYAFTPPDRDEPIGVTLDWGVSRSIGRNLQVDLEAGRGLTGPAPDWFVGFGLAVRGRFSGER
jgi:hypothetical protein